MATKKYDTARKKIPAEIQRVVKVEARHSCIVDGERVVLELHHIDGNRENNDPENIACLCRNCHGIAELGKITPLELKEYKRLAKEKANEESEELRKIRQELEYLTGRTSTVSVSPAFNELQIKYKNILRDFSEKMLFYQSFIYLIPQFFLDKRGERAREIVRELLNITIDEEGTIISHLKTAGLIEITGDLVSLKDKTDAKVALGQLIDSGRLDLNKTIHFFVNI
jgi:hypothetical protein